MKHGPYVQHCHKCPQISIFVETAKSSKYQGVKEFHMLARIGCYCNITVFSPFKVKVTYYHPLNQ